MKILYLVHWFIFKVFWGSENRGIPPTPMVIPSCIFILFSNTIGNINTTANLKLPPSISSLWPLVLHFVLQSNCVFGDPWLWTTEMVLFWIATSPRAIETLPGDKEVCAETFGHWMPLLIQQRSADGQRHLQRKYFSSLSQKILSHLHLENTLWLAEKSIYPWFSKHLSVHFCLHGFQNLIF